jgi:hypothetical protein
MSVQTIVQEMITAAATTAGAQWGEIQPVVTREVEVLGRRIAQIAAGVAAGELTRDDARDFFEVIRNHAIANVAMMSALVRSAAQRIINAAMEAAKTGINRLIGFAILA